MALTDKDVQHVARLARLAVSPDDIGRLKTQLSSILDFVNKLAQYDTKDVPPTTHVVPVANVWREDVAKPFGDTEPLLALAPDREDMFFKVKKIIE